MAFHLFEGVIGGMLLSESRGRQNSRLFTLIRKIDNYAKIRKIDNYAKQEYIHTQFLNHFLNACSAFFLKHLFKN
jgi:hypothetical protein